MTKTNHKTQVAIYARVSTNITEYNVDKTCLFFDRFALDPVAR